MPIELAQIRDLLLPGLREIVWQYKDWPAYWEEAFTPQFVPATPHIWVPKLSVPMAVGIGVAAAVIKNPEVTRRFWKGWGHVSSVR